MKKTYSKMKKLLMNNMLRLAVSLLLFHFITHSQAQSKILWLGNSYTGVNNLPQMFYDLALSGGDTVVFDSNTPGGMTLLGHSGNATTIQKIYSQKWNYVVVQAQSQEPSFSPGQVAQQTLPYARILDSLITDNDSCTETVYYMTWGRKYGDQSNCANYPPICTFDGMQARLRESYLLMAEDNQAITAPAGMAWHKSWHTDTLIDLWSGDFSHPSVAGTYLTACVFYASIFRKSPIGLSYSPISAQTTNYLQTIAHQTVFDSLSQWKIGTYLPQAGFDFSGDETTKTFSFNNQSLNFDSYEWQFGDGNSSTTSGVHTYSDTGTYTVSLVISDNCGNSDTSSQILTIQNPNNITEKGETSWWVLQNPANQYLRIASDFRSKMTYTIVNVYGQNVLSGEIENQVSLLNISALQPGPYLLMIDSRAQKFWVEKHF